MTIVQIGCNNGSDHVLDFCLKNKESIKEIHLIEANLEALDDCKKTYSDFHQAKFHNLAIVQNDIQSINLHIPKSKLFNEHASSFASHLIAHGHSDFNTVTVLALSLADFFDLNKIMGCDRLYIDAEGLDCDILLGLDIKKYKIQRIEFEVLHADGVFTKAQKYFSCIEKFKNLGYRSTDAAQYNEAYQL